MRNPPGGPSRWRGVFRAIIRLATLEEPTYVWRGHQDVFWGLVPLINRKLGYTPPLSDAGIVGKRNEVDAETRALIALARSHRHHVLGGWEMPDLPLLALLQHNGAATPPLDVTTDPIVALHFAAQPAPGTDTDGLLIAIDARGDRVESFAVGADLAWPEVLERLETNRKSLGLYTPPMVTPRIMAQRGRFIFGELAAGIDYSVLPVAQRTDWSGTHLAKLFAPTGPGRLRVPPVLGIRVPRADKKKIRDVIDASFGLNDETLFPDFHGFAGAHSRGGPRLARS
jgi:FRG domain-containing protein